MMMLPTERPVIKAKQTLQTTPEAKEKDTLLEIELFSKGARVSSFFVRGFLFGVVDGNAIVLIWSLSWNGGEFHVKNKVLIWSGSVDDHAAIDVLGERDADWGCRQDEDGKYSEDQGAAHGLKI